MDFIRKIKERIANVAVSASAMRNQGGRGIVQKCRVYFINNISLEDFFSVIDVKSNYDDYLNKHTSALMKRLGKSTKYWGAARKALNLFFRDVVYNKFLADHYGLPTNQQEYDNAIQNLEIPLDRYVATQLYARDRSLPKWVSIKSLKSATSERYQKVALGIADQMQTARVHLDLIWWRTDLISNIPKK